MPNSMKPSSAGLVYCILHAVVAAVFFFVLQYWGFNSSEMMAVSWGLVGGLGAGYLSWSQQSRNGGA
jgi:hypothetical protein